MAELFTIEIDVNGQALSYRNNELIASGDQGVDYVEFFFEDHKWDVFTDLFVVFSRYGDTAYKVPLVDCKAEIPSEVMQKPGNLIIGLFGANEDEVMTSTTLIFNLKQGCISVEDITPTYDIYEQFIQDLNAYHQAVSDLATIQGEVTDLQGDVSELQTEAQNIQTNLDNSQTTFEGYISEAKGFADESEYYAGLSEQASAKSGYLYFEIDARGRLMMTRTENTQVTFYLDNGHLYLQGV